MKQKYVIGIDISKSKLDCTVMDFEYRILYEMLIPNTEQKIFSFLKDIMNLLKITKEELMICCGNTGIYNRPLELFCTQSDYLLWVEHPVKIKKASSDLRGKDDRKDARRIAEYAVRYHDKKLPYKEPSQVVKQMNVLSKSRDSLLVQKTALENQLREAKSHDPFEFKVLSQSFSKTLKTLVSEIKKIEKQLLTLIESEVEIKKNKDLLVSIPGIGMQTAINFIIITDNFKNFENAKHLACYAGVVPFKSQSGTIVKKERISKMANQKLKKLLHLSAMATIRSDNELKAYFVRKVEQGKNKMSVLDAIRNKLVHRIMAVIKRQQPYLSQEEFLSTKNSNFPCLLT
ncbi:IS110 family transposase [Chryseobacterium gambrini]|uniref:IS110 family transposase n=1 Tax=Chryseobacterium gambrini TaxID=373672 RepID=A0ABM8K5P9_9FLAO|nr:IS110 family transposase [Chryseobacterium gambrini]